MKNKKIIIGIITLGLLTSLQSGAGVQAKKIENKLQVKQKKITMSVGEKKKIKVTAKKKFLKKLVWKSSNKKVATVNQKGVVKAKKKGTAKITVFVKKNKKIKTSFTVKVKKKMQENTVKTPATAGAINVTGSAVTLYSGGWIDKKNQGWFWDKGSIQELTQNNEELKNRMNTLLERYNDNFFKEKAVYLHISSTSSVPAMYSIESAFVKQNDEGKWICEVKVKKTLVSEEGVSYPGNMNDRAFFFEFDKKQIEGVTEVVLIEEVVR